MNAPKIAGYALGCLYPASAQHQPVPDTIAQLQASGFDTVILSLFHIAGAEAQAPRQPGDLSFNDTPVISGATYIGDPGWPALVAQLPGGSVATVCASIGGGGVSDFANLAQIYKENGNSFANTNLAANFAAFRTTFPGVTIIDMDCEETYDLPSFVAFCQMLAQMGFYITFCPYCEPDFWTGALQALQARCPGAVLWWNLQCYDGGAGNVPADWAAALGQALPGFCTDGFIVAGDWTDDTPAGVTSLLQSFDTNACLGGGFLWTLDKLAGQPGAMQAYAQAIAVGLEPAANLRTAV
jgi:hypothetical protein